VRMRYTRNRRFRRRNALHDIPLTPLIDVALTLLVIFMVASPMLNNVIKVSLPKGNVQEDAHTTQEYVVYVDENNTLFFDGKSMNDADIVKALKEALAGKEDQVVFVKADEAARYGSILELIDTIKDVGGIKHVALATQQKRG